MIDVEESNVVEQREVTLKTVERWIASGYIQGVRLPGDYRERPESEITALLTRMFELPNQLDEDPLAPAPRRHRQALRPEEWGPG